MPAPILSRSIPVAPIPPIFASNAITSAQTSPAVDGMAVRSFLPQGAALPGLPAGLTTSTLSATTPGRSFEPAARVDITSYVTGARNQTVNHPERKRDINPYIPGNSVKMLAHAADINETHAGIISWLKQTEYFTAENIDALIANPGVQHPWEVNNPVISQPIATDLRETIRGAKETLFVDIFLMGGTWGMDIAKELLLASERGVKVVLVRDTDNKFSSGFEMEPLWDALEAHSYDNPNLTVMRSQINKRPSGLPFGLDNITKLFAQFFDLPLSLAAKSDHSKVVIADGLTAKPSMWVGSKNTVDSGGSFFFDEVFHIDGPAAAASQLSFLEDIREARVLAVKEGRNGGQPSDAWVDGLIGRMERRKSGLERTVVHVAGDASVQIVENNADDSVRNAESSILALLEGAETSIDMYQFLAYSPSIAEALARAIHRGVEVRILMDSVGKKVEMNNLLAVLMNEHGVSQSQIDSMIRWRSQLPGGSQIDEGVENPIEEQQQHTKTIIVDGKRTLAGSTNFDIASLSGAFREFSVTVEDEAAATIATERFEALFNSAVNSRPYDTEFQEPLSFWGWIARIAARNILVSEAWRIGSLRPGSLFG